MDITNSNSIPPGTLGMDTFDFAIPRRGASVTCSDEFIGTAGRFLVITL